MAKLWIWTEAIFLVVEQIYSELFYRYFIESMFQKRVDERRLMSYSNHTDIQRKPDPTPFEKLKHKLEQKDEIHFEHNFQSVTVLCYLKDMKDKFQIKPATQSHNLYNTVLIFITQIMMLSCMLYAIVNGEDETSAYTKM